MSCVSVEFAILHGIDLLIFELCPLRDKTNKAEQVGKLLTKCVLSG